ncbi:Fe-S cluster assembly protein SufD [Belliella aquatica]|uniref:Fe-S cluster assembly protein SufD n=1 Tax=Belliella aquatica TaxID=1323734 RepID=A0ABQ1MHP3_9BACT|nr:Fe-S cluster assembly protein SufD [Belliella aquatica]MCH7405171.1 Fe-S cluster assembly protein SufD [Belliella aquatica]GGC39172.1 Fe-S cluster assembly protein SufD [Belliella aquatica]
MTTITKNKATDQFLENIAYFSNFQELRNESLAFLKNTGLPHSKEEEYKFTQISKKIEQNISTFLAADKISISAELIKSNLFEGFEGDVVVFNNGLFIEELSSISSPGYTLSKLSDSNSELLGSVAKIENDPFVALNNLSFEDGIHIKTEKGKKVEKPILFLYFNQANQGQIIQPRVLIEVAENSEVTFIENTVSQDEETYFSNTVVEVKVAQNAHAYYYRLQNENRKAISVTNFATDIHRYATFTSVALQLQADMLRNNLTLNLLDKGCVGNMYGLYLLNGKTHVDNHTNVDHTKPNSDSNELYKGILTDSARGVFNGKIFVRQDAQKTNAFQQNNNILLSENAIINTKPQLEIWADDVKCSHGCTTGQLDEEALFYLQARGIGKEQARGLLLYAVAGEVLEQIAYEPFKAYCIQLVEDRLGSSF